MKLFQSLLVITASQEAHDLNNDGHGSDVPYGRVISRDQIESMERGPRPRPIEQQEFYQNEIEPLIAQQALLNQQYASQAALDIYQPSRITATNAAQAQLNQQWAQAHQREREFYQNQYQPQTQIQAGQSHFQQQANAYLNHNNMSPYQARDDSYYHQQESLSNQISNLQFQDQQAISSQNAILAQKLEEKLRILQQVQKEVSDQRALLRKIMTQKQQQAADAIASKRPYAEVQSTTSTGKYEFEEPVVLPRYPANVRENNRIQLQPTAASKKTVEIIQFEDESNSKGCFVENAVIK